MAKPKSKFFRVAVEGATTDGREITRDWIQQMAATYNPAKYGARVFAEHIRGMLPDGPFRAFGDVVALKAEEISDGDLKGKLALYAQIDPSDAMVRLIRSGQKIYSSIEVDPGFAGGDLAYLMGLGITDSPASLGTEVLSFAAAHPDASPFRSRKQRPENLFSAAQESDIELDADEPVSDAPESRFFAKLTDILEKFSGKTKTAVHTDPATAVTHSPTDVAEFAAALREGVDEVNQRAATITQSVADIRATIDAHVKDVDAKLAAFRTELDTTPATTETRPRATGGDGAIATDC